jgi:hypothetical protein
MQSVSQLFLALVTSMGALSGSISPAQRFQLALNAGFSAPDAVVAAAISLLECGNCDMGTYNSTGDSGLWQINRMHGYSLTAMADPAANASAAYDVFKRQGFKAWCVYPGGCGGTSPTTWATFNAKIAQVTSSISEAGGTIPPISLPSDGGSVDPTPDIPLTGGGATGAVKLANVLGKDVGIPTGLVIGLLGVLVLVIAALMLVSANVSVQAPGVRVATPQLRVKAPGA